MVKYTNECELMDFNAWVEVRLDLMNCVNTLMLMNS